jgi:hypothetical protein
MRCVVSGISLVIFCFTKWPMVSGTLHGDEAMGAHPRFENSAKNLQEQSSGRARSLHRSVRYKRVVPTPNVSFCVVDLIKAEQKSGPHRSLAEFVLHL